MTHARLHPVLYAVLRSITVAICGVLLLVSPAGGQTYEVQEAVLDGGGGRVSGGNLTLTSSLSTSPAGTVSTERYVLYSAWPSPFSGRAAILIIHDPAPGERAEGGQPKGITARIVTNRAELRSATLYYRSGASNDEPEAVAMTAEEDGYTATIPGAAIDETGLTYYFVAEDANGTTVRAPRRGVYSLPVNLGGRTLERPGEQPGGDTKSAYRLLSIPVELDDASPEAVLGDDIPTLASASAYDPSEARLFEPIGTSLAEFPNTADFDLGRAFWLIVRDEVETIDTEGGTVKALNDPAEIDLRQGWNFVGTPFTTPVPVGNLRTTNSDSLTLRSYDSDGYNTPENPVTEMQPFEGYAVFAETATTLTIQPPVPEDGTSLERANTNTTSGDHPFPWRLRIRGTAAHGQDLDNVAAVHAEASDEWDARDWPEPPSVGSTLRISFDAPRRAPADVSLSADVRQPPTRGSTWPFTVETDSAGAVHLSVEGVPDVPELFAAWLVDVETKESWNLRSRSQARLEVLSDGAVRPMRLVVGTKAYVGEALRSLDASPLEYALHPPYPNPSGGEVAFQLGLPNDERVTVSVYNILGQRVAVLKDRAAMSAGVHTVVWDPPRLASGMYFVRMEAGDYRETEKLVRVR